MLGPAVYATPRRSGYLAPVKIDRRLVLAAMAALPVAACAGLGGEVGSWWHAPLGADRKVLSDGEFGFMEGVAEAWMPRGGTPALSGKDAGLAAFVDAVVARMPEPERSLVRLLFNALDDLTVVSHLTRFRNLDLADRTAVLAEWVDNPSSNIRQAIRAVLALLSEGWTQHPDVIEVIRPMFPCGVGA